MEALVIGCAACVWDDLQRAPQMQAAYEVLACKQAAHDYQHHIDYVICADTRVAHLYPLKGVPLVSRAGLGEFADIVYDEFPYRNGSSGLYAVGFALLRGASRVICAGVPIDDQPHYFYKPAPFRADGYRAAWERALPVIKGRVFSLSGWTRDLLGEPH